MIKFFKANMGPRKGLRIAEVIISILLCVFFVNLYKKVLKCGKGHSFFHTISFKQK